jgi:hypothetical protein
MLDSSLWKARAAAARFPLVRRDRPSEPAGFGGVGVGGLAAPEGGVGRGSRGIVVGAEVRGAIDVVAAAGAVVRAAETGGVGELASGMVVSAPVVADAASLPGAEVVVVIAPALVAGFGRPATRGQTKAYAA